MRNELSAYQGIASEVLLPTRVELNGTHVDVCTPDSIPGPYCPQEWESPERESFIRDEVEAQKTRTVTSSGKLFDMQSPKEPSCVTVT